MVRRGREHTLRTFTLRSPLIVGAAISTLVCVNTAHAEVESDGLRGRAPVDAGAHPPENPSLSEPTEQIEPTANNMDEFELLGVTIAGAQSIPVSSLSDNYEGYLTHRVSIEDLSVIAQAITDQYRAEGYFLSRAVVPPQTPDSGVAQIVVIEGRIDEVVFEGDAAAQVAPYFAGLTEAGAVSLPDLERRLTLARDVPGIEVKSRVEPHPDDPSTHRLVIEAAAERVHAYTSIHNRGSNSAGPVQTSVGLDVRSVFHPRDQLSFFALATPEEVSEFALMQLGYSVVGAGGDRFGASVLGFQSEDGSDDGSPELGGDGATFTVFYEHPLLRRRRQGLWLGGAFDARHVRYDWSNGGGYEDQLRVARLSLRGFFNENGRSTSFWTQASFGLDALGASGRSQTRRSRASADAQFLKLNARGTYYMDIGRHFGIYGQADLQASSDALLYSEELSLGGARYGRAYNYGEISGDHGVAGSAEFRAGYNPSADSITFAQAYAFLDGGQVWNLDAGGSDAALASVGLGARITLWDAMTLSAELARPMTRTPYQEGDKDWRSFFGVTAVYP